MLQLLTFVKPLLNDKNSTLHIWNNIGDRNGDRIAILQSSER
jgi:hypothetical protein